MKVLKSLNTWSYCAFYCIGCTRIKSIQGWIYPWMEWSYSTVPDSKELVSQQLDIYGYLYLASPLIGFVPGVLSVLFQKITSKLPANGLKSHKWLDSDFIPALLEITLFFI